MYVFVLSRHIKFSQTQPTPTQSPTIPLIFQPIIRTPKAGKNPNLVLGKTTFKAINVEIPPRKVSMISGTERLRLGCNVSKPRFRKLSGSWSLRVESVDPRFKFLEKEDENGKGNPDSEEGWSKFGRTWEVRVIRWWFLGNLLSHNRMRELRKMVERLESSKAFDIRVGLKDRGVDGFENRLEIW